MIVVSAVVAPVDRSPVDDDIAVGAATVDAHMHCHEPSDDFVCVEDDANHEDVVHFGDTGVAIVLSGDYDCAGAAAVGNAQVGGVVDDAGGLAAVSLVLVVAYAVVGILTAAVYVADHDK